MTRTAGDLLKESGIVDTIHLRAEANVKQGQFIFGEATLFPDIEPERIINTLTQVDDALDERFDFDPDSSAATQVPLNLTWTWQGVELSMSYALNADEDESMTASKEEQTRQLVTALKQTHALMPRGKSVRLGKDSIHIDFGSADSLPADLISQLPPDATITVYQDLILRGWEVTASPSTSTVLPTEAIDTFTQRVSADSLADEYPFLGVSATSILPEDEDGYDVRISGLVSAGNTKLSTALASTTFEIFPPCTWRKLDLTPAEARQRKASYRCADGKVAVSDTASQADQDFARELLDEVGVG
ncbi:hypothetical protein [Schaalia vaccimaxillae]|uniref:hypothetical protein n=1 Tax=Schaalia vaccimaxillae TaxID=183916 RepID=UPI0003B4D517|nr:hypothetical protein [Schaalia vaccimaxillae]